MASAASAQHDASPQSPKVPPGWEVSPAFSGCYGILQPETGAFSLRLQRTYRTPEGEAPRLFLAAQVPIDTAASELLPVTVRLAGENVTLSEGSMVTRIGQPAQMNAVIEGDSLRRLADMEGPVALEIVSDGKIVSRATADAIGPGIERLATCFAEVGEKLMAERAPGDDGTGERAPFPRRSPAQWVSTNDYPLRALREGAQGRAVFRLTVSRFGFPAKCEIIESAGNQYLDAATCKMVMRRATFYPARDASGDAVEGTYSKAVAWMIPN